MQSTVLAKDNPMNSNDFGEQVLGLLVSFAAKMDDAGLLPDMDPTAVDQPQVPAGPTVAEGLTAASPSQAQAGPTAPAQSKQPACPGAQAKAGPPLPPESLHWTDANSGGPASSSSGSTTKPPSMMPPSSKYAPGLPSAPSAYEAGTHTKGRLVCSPEQMKQFLYGNAPRPKGSHAQNTDALLMIEQVVNQVSFHCF